MLFGRKLIALLLLVIPATASAADLAQSLFNRHQHGVVQVRVIDTASGEKSSIGSGFAVQPDGLIVSNYHVVASYVEHPDKYRLEYTGPKGGIGALKLLDIDVINDLSVLTISRASNPEAEEDIPSSRFAISARNLSKGADIFSMGNPLDLGMTIVQGIYNGQPEHSLYQRILFSGSLNPGMSGGPALARDGEVIGVNVSTAGNEISFLVPAVYIRALLDRVRKSGTEKVANFTQRIEAQLFTHQHNYIAPLLKQAWQNKPLAGSVKTPERVADFMKCWGQSGKDEDALYDAVNRFCSNQDSIYLGSRFRTGRISYNFQLLKDKSLGTLRFYNLYQGRYQSLRAEFGYGDKEEVSDLVCHNDIVSMGQHQWKVGFCSRRYKKYTSIYDIAVSMALMKEHDRGVIANLKIEGCGKDNGLKLVRKFMESIQ